MQGSTWQHITETVAHVLLQDADFLLSQLIQCNTLALCYPPPHASGEPAQFGTGVKDALTLLGKPFSYLLCGRGIPCSSECNRLYTPP
jgi:hypothetical protein